MTIPIQVTIKINLYFKLRIKSIYFVGGSPEFFNANTKSVNEAIPIINEAVLFIKSIIEKANEYFK